MDARRGSCKNDWSGQSDNSCSPRSDVYEEQSQQLHYNKKSINNQQSWAIDDIANVFDNMNMPQMSDNGANYDQQPMSNYQQQQQQQPNSSDLQVPKSERKMR